MPPPILAIVGATATGKSALGMSLAKALSGEIINADALQVYRGFDVGTAKPSRAEQGEVRHHLVDVLEAHERYSAGEFVRRARAAIAEVTALGKVPIVVGGSGLYVRALVSGISPVPPGDPEIRARLVSRVESEGLPVLAAELAVLDPETAARLAPADTQRILRALEVALVTGVSLSAWIARQPFGIQGIAAIQVGLTLPRGILYDRIASRVAGMVRGGWIEEVVGLLGRGMTPGLPAFQAIGYRQLARYAAAEVSLEPALAETLQATRRFAKRQETWFRKEPGVTWFPADYDLDFLTSRVLAHIRERGL